LEQGDSVVAGFTDEEAQVPASAKAPKFIFGDHTCRMRLSTLPFSVFPNTIVLDSKIADTYWAFLATKDLQKFESYRRHWMELAQKHIVFPNGDLDRKFGNLVAPLFTKIDSALLECQLLVEIRDTLLPRLISGELEIPDELLVD
jgi:type I restriction enzyme S subunit